MSYSITKTLPVEIVYAYALTQRYNHLNKRYKNNLYSNHLKAVMPKEELDKYIKTFVTYYQTKYHEEMYIFSNNEIPFSENSFTNIDNSKSNENIFNQMFSYDKKNNTLSTTKLYNPKFVEKYCNSIITKEEQDVLNKTECLNISTNVKAHYTNDELSKIQYYKHNYSDLQYNILLLKQREFEKELNHQCSILKYFVLSINESIPKSNKTSFSFSTKNLTKTVEFLAENINSLTKTVESLIMCGSIIKYGLSPENIATNKELTNQAKTLNNDLHLSLKEIFTKHKMDINEKEIDYICEELIVLSPILNKVGRVSESIHECKLQLEAIRQVLPKRQMNKQIGNNTPPEKAISKYEKMKKQQRILTNINGKQNVRPINTSDVDTYKNAKMVIKENKSKGGR